MVTLSNVNLGKTALEWLSKVVLLENLKQSDELLDQLFFFWRFLWQPQAKRNLHLIFLQTSKQIPYESLQTFFFHLWSLRGTKEAVGGVFLNFQNVLVRVGSVNIAGKMAPPLCYLPWWNGSFIRGEWLRKPALSQPIFSQLLIIYETGERSTKS